MLNLLRWVFAGAVGRNDRDISGVPAFEDVSSRRRLSGHELAAWACGVNVGSRRRGEKGN
jgi:hypothetical protein